MSHSFMFVLVSSTGVFFWTSWFRWASEQGLCVFQSPWIPLWTLSGFGLWAALPVSIKRSVGAGVWHCHRTWWETADQSQTAEHRSFYFLHHYVDMPLVLYICQRWTLKMQSGSIAVLETQKNWILNLFYHAKEICNLETFAPLFVPHVFVPHCVFVENEFNDLQDLSVLRGAAEVKGFVPSCPLFHLLLAVLRLDGCRMERWQNKKLNRHVSALYPPQPARALT